ncbi:hypothetical protein BDB01DRAFT_790396 [Pilobolus umbonatus]|nr:hypothetical protein BDB01DRAFT_790396 [Pilobolus umbonatus]
MQSSKQPLYNQPPTDAVPDYNTQQGMSYQQKEQQYTQRPTQSNGYPGNMNRTPDELRDIQGYDIQGNPIIPPFIAQRHQIEQSLGPTCVNQSYHNLRMHLTKTSLLYAILIVPYCCGFRGRREVNKTKNKWINV